MSITAVDTLDNDDTSSTVGAMQLFLESCYNAELKDLLDDENTSSLAVDLGKVIEFNVELAQTILDRATFCLPLFNVALVSALRKLTGTTTSSVDGARVRVEHLPNHPALQRTKMPGSEDVGHLLTISGTVIRTGMVKMMETQKRYACLKCRGTFVVRAQLEQYNYIPKPARCLAPGEDYCNSNAFAPVEGLDALEARLCCTDYQEIKIQEQVGRLALGTIPRSIVVILEANLVDVLKSGDSALVTGTLVRRWRGESACDRPDIALALYATSVNAGTSGGSLVSITNDFKLGFRSFWQTHASAPMRGRDIIVASMCPQVYGLYYIKLAVLLILIGGVARADSSGLRVRGEAHLLLVGDPGTAKSQFLKYAAKLIPRSVLTTGIGSTSAGLTVTAVRDGAEWQLEAGALVLADRGICCIDEFGSIRDAEKGTVLEAMEQQSISVAKAGIVCKLNARCSVLAAMNPKSKYDLESSLAINTALSSPLLSRFDLILVMLDSPNEKWDNRVSSFIIDGQNMDDEDHPVWPFDELQAYIAYVKTSIHPVSTPDSERVLTKYYQIQRQRDSANASRTTIRLLESLIRLSQAHARLMFRDKVLVQDAVIAVVLMETTMLSASILGFANDALRTTFPEDSQNFYQDLETLVLQRLDISK
ncbi:DNA helicase mcm9 [Coemansia sp. RSA 2337]|nr:DNA helicase mcm9 [Coemansia sp. RSA 922]KAJ2467120.1 DNA helicase mcm9 [Coemansia sp. RSA 2337]